MELEGVAVSRIISSNHGTSVSLCDCENDNDNDNNRSKTTKSCSNNNINNRFTGEPLTLSMIGTCVDNITIVSFGDENDNNNPNNNDNCSSTNIRKISAGYVNINNKTTTTTNNNNNHKNDDEKTESNSKDNETINKGISNSSNNNYNNNNNNSNNKPHHNTKSYSIDSGTKLIAEPKSRSLTNSATPKLNYQSSSKAVLATPKNNNKSPKTTSKNNKTSKNIKKHHHQSHPNISTRQSESPDDSCPICLDTIGGASSKVLLRECGHAFCRRCLECYIKVCLSAALRPDCECPEADCRTPIHPNDYPLILTNSTDLAAWERSQVRSAISPGQRRHRLVCCPTPGCPNMILFRPSSNRLLGTRKARARRCANRASRANPNTGDGDGALPNSSMDVTSPSLLLSDDEVICDACHIHFCAKCGLRAHADGEVCPEAVTRRVQRWVPNHRPALGPNSRYCPTCSTPVTKEGGCNIVHCPVCRCYFCWFCGQKDDRGPNGSNCLAHWTAFCKLRGDRLTGKLNATTVKNPLLKLLVALLALIGGFIALPIMVTWALCIVFPYNFFWDCYFSTPHDVSKKIINATAAILFLLVCCISMPIMWAALYACCWGDIFGFIWRLFRPPGPNDEYAHSAGQLSPSALMRSTSVSINNTDHFNLRNTQLTTPDSEFEGSIV